MGTMKGQYIEGKKHSKPIQWSMNMNLFSQSIIKSIFCTQPVAEYQFGWFRFWIKIENRSTKHSLGKQEPHLFSLIQFLKSVQSENAKRKQTKESNKKQNRLFNQTIENECICTMYKSWSIVSILIRNKKWI